jgi:protease IV
MKLRETKPVYCSMGDLAASGGYYIAAACSRIFANPGTLTGSIGVIMSFMNIKGLYAWAKIEPEILKAGKFKDIGTESRAMTPEERGLLQTLLSSVHTQFKNAIAAARPELSRETLETYADGRIFTGETAQKLGFVDDVGGLIDTLDALKEELKIEEELRVASANPRKNRLSLWLEQASALDRMRSDTKTKIELNLLSDAVFEKLGQIVPQLNSEIKPGQPYLLPYHWFEGGGGALNSR